jgi:membrane-associated phospholipid phosphatase
MHMEGGTMISGRRSTTPPIGLLVLFATLALSACVDSPTHPNIAPPALTARFDAVKFWDATASTTWNRRAIALAGQRPPGNAQAAVSRILTYLSLAQYRAALAAEDGKIGSTHPSVPAAVGAASAAVLDAFFPLDVSAINAQLAADLASPSWPGAAQEDGASGMAIGRAVAVAMLARATSDNYLVASPGVPPVGPAFWVSSAAPIVRSLYRVRPFFLASQNQLLPPPPPAFGSQLFLTALAEIRAISDTRTPEQLAAAQFWNLATAPFTAGAENLIADELIRDHHRTEREAARILAYANAAAFDAQIACFDAKFTYWFIRPSQADPLITLPIGLPNHPSYPSAHSCITAAIMTVLIDAFPSERDTLTANVHDAGLSRMYGGLHYRFDVEAGQTIGYRAAALALAGGLER